MYQKDTRIAEKTGIYRCTGLGQKKFVKAGERLPACSCEQDCKWVFEDDDNKSQFAKGENYEPEEN